MPPVSMDPDDGRVSIILPGLMAVREGGVWRVGAVTTSELMDDFRVVRDPKEAAMLVQEARAALSSK
jgi:hypothetical protein